MAEVAEFAPDRVPNTVCTFQRGYRCLVDVGINPQATTLADNALNARGAARNSV